MNNTPENAPDENQPAGWPDAPEEDIDFASLGSALGHLIPTEYHERIAQSAKSVRAHSEQELSALMAWVFHVEYCHERLRWVLEGLIDIEWEGRKPKFHFNHHTPVDPGGTPFTVELPTQNKTFTRSCPSCGVVDTWWMTSRAARCRSCGYRMPREDFDQMERIPSAAIRQKILAVVDHHRGAYWGDFYDALIPAHTVEDVH